MTSGAQMSKLTDEQDRRQVEGRCQVSEQEQFHDVNYCRSEILEVRKYVTDATKQSEHMFQRAFDVLTMMLIHCPDSFVETVRAHITETNTRYLYWLLKGSAK
jgi:hypothetical protein